MAALTGIRILELARVPPAELPGMLLSDLGADVLKIETPLARPLSDQDRRRAVFSAVNRNKRSLALNLKTPDGQAIFLKLARAADVIVEGFRPGVMRRLGADYDAIQALNPRIVYCSLSGFGQTGPYRHVPAHDLNYLALSGILSLIGEAGRTPQIPLNLVADYGGASLHGALGIMVALFARERTGRGQHVDVSYLDASISLLGATPNMRGFWSDDAPPARGAGFLSGMFPYYAVYETKDARYITIACYEPVFWERFCAAIERPDLARFAFRDEHAVRAPTPEETAARADVQRLIATRTRDEWWRLLTDAGTCVAPVYDPAEAFADPQVRARGMVVSVQHPEYGEIHQTGTAIKLSETADGATGPAPVPGEHTDGVLTELGFSREEIAALRARGVCG
jgi:alpha-methylacyl-CoA racemase